MSSHEVTVDAMVWVLWVLAPETLSPTYRWQHDKEIGINSLDLVDYASIYVIARISFPSRRYAKNLFVLCFKTLKLPLF